jgi:hypothetical protein
MNIRLIAACSLFALAAACTTPTAQYVPLPAQDVSVTSKDVARIYFVREETAGLRQSEIKILDGSTEIGLLSTSTYLCWERAPGRTLAQAHYLSVDPGVGKIEGLLDLDCAAGSVQYFNVIVQRETLTPKITRLSTEEGKKLVADRTWAGAK